MSARTLKRLCALGVALLALLGCAGGSGDDQPARGSGPRLARSGSAPPLQDLATAERLREECGIEVVRLALTAGGAMVELRWVVTDPERSGAALQSALLLEREQDRVALPVASVVRLGPLRAQSGAPGRMRYALFGNAAKIERGTVLTLRVGERRYAGLVVG